LQLDGNAALALQVHLIENLLAHLAQADGGGLLKQAISQRRFPVIYMGDDAKVPDEALFHS
jgi:hypothetical protein